MNISELVSFFLLFIKFINTYFGKKNVQLEAVVECMAAGTIMLAHNSAGPKMDIVVPYKGEKTGFLAETDDEYAEWLFTIFTMSQKRKSAIRDAAREHVRKFSQENFNISFMEAFKNFCYDKFVSSRIKVD
jgi:glycosyltransferase involved in cell wall biosynthesis